MKLAQMLLLTLTEGQIVRIHICLGLEFMHGNNNAWWFEKINPRHIDFTHAYIYAIKIRALSRKNYSANINPLATCCSSIAINYISANNSFRLYKSYNSLKEGAILSHTMSQRVFGFLSVCCLHPSSLVT